MKRLLVVPLALAAALAGAATRRIQDQCGPFTDVSPLYCPYVLEAYYTGITAGTSATTFSPDLPITRAQSAVFTTKALNQALARGSRSAALGQWWTTTPEYAAGLGVVPDAYGPVCADGSDIWVNGSSGVNRVRASDGRLLETWLNYGGYLVSAMGRIFIATTNQPGELLMIDPSQASGTPVLLADNLGNQPTSLAFDGARLWTANKDGSISIVTPQATTPWPVTTVTQGLTGPFGLVYDGTNMWVTDTPVHKIHRLDANGAILQSVDTGDSPQYPAFDGQNIWVPNCCQVVLITASTGAPLDVAVGNGLSNPTRAAFDGRRMMLLSGNSDQIWVFDAAALAPESPGPVSLGSGAYLQGAASDGINFWITLGNGQMGRY